MTRNRLNAILVEHRKNEELSTISNYTDSDIRDILGECKVAQEELYSEHRWWNESTVVVAIADTFIGFTVASTTGDNSASDCGYEPQPLLDDLFEAKAVTKTVTVYE